MKFEEMGLSKPLLDALAAMKFAEPTPIQGQAIPILLKGEDLIGQARTGTGKTAAFGLPILENWLKMQRAQPHQAHPDNTHNPLNMRNRFARENRGGHDAPAIAVPSALILVPTRELAVQVHATLQKMAANTGAHIIPIYGGVEMRKQLRMFRTPVDIVVGTPGRTLDHMRQNTLNVGKVTTVVLDEADRMLDMGFLRDVVRILERMPSHRQTMLFSATMPKEISQVAHKFMRNPKSIKVSEDSLAVDGIKQLYVRCTGGQRVGMLLAAIRTEKPFLSLVFCRMKHEAKRLAQQLRANGIKADAMHGNLNQRQRDKAMESFRTGRIDVMVATDLASRGIDVPGITHVFNYELPPDPMTYVHRIGRTARAGAKGTAISFIGGDPRHALWDIERTTGSKLSELMLVPDVPAMQEKHEERRAHDFGQQQHGRQQHGGYGRQNQSQQPSHVAQHQTQHPQHAAPHQTQHPQHAAPHQTQHPQHAAPHQTQHPQHAAPHQTQHPHVGHGGQQQTQHSQVSHGVQHQTLHPQSGQQHIQHPHGKEEGGGKRFWENRKEKAQQHGYGGQQQNRGPRHHSSHKRR